jgi:predicted GNAT family acetyltransferase
MTTSVRNNAEKSRYEIWVDDRLAGVAEYRRRGDRVVFPHTHIETALRNQGLGAELVRRALDDVRAAGDNVAARCWFVAQFIDEHPQYTDLLAE